MLASQALQVVLEHSMLPAQFGLNLKTFETQIQTLREEILVHQAKTFQNNIDLDVDLAEIPEVVSPYEFIVADDLEKNSGKYLKALLTSVSQSGRRYTQQVRTT
jgi:hypothetical protein